MKTETTLLEDKTTLLNKALENAMSYEEYRTLTIGLTAETKTTGSHQTEALINYTKLNDARMRRLDKTTKISEEATRLFLNYSKKVTWLVLTESWCGDAAQSMPVINKLANVAQNVSYKVVLRDEHPALMQHFLTNGGMSIPKLIAIDDASKIVLGHWGPRPTEATKMVTDHKQKHGTITPEFKQELQVWYTKDKGVSIVEDIEKILK
ncbi:thioredoxin family protein [Patiriisocius sp. Uisw_017]|uniref:thioredoxin family protein n=1 Tax=Patiriisocius sp. Uisw_017 TaxID=3230968 RepID=UPI0039EACF97